MKNSLWASASLIALLALSPTGAMSQSQEYQPIGARAGAFIFKPKIELTEEYNSNIFREEDDEAEDFITVLTPSLIAESDWSRHFVAIDLGVEGGFYADNDEDNYVDAWAEFDGELDATRATQFFVTDVGFRREHEERGDDDSPTDADEPTVYYRLGGLVGARHKPNRLGVEATASAYNFDFEDTDLIGGGEIDGSLRDRTEFDFGLRVGYDIQEGYEAFVKGVYEIVNYDEEVNAGGFDRDSDGYTLYGGMAFEPSPLIRADIGLGYETRDYDDPQLDSVDGVFGSLDATWFATPLTTVTLGVTSAIEETTAADAAGKLRYEFTLGVEHELLRNVVLNGAAGYGRQEFDGSTSDREDDDFSFDLGAKYWLNRNFYAGAGYEFDYRDSTAQGEDYIVHQVGVTIGAQL